jgi:hypothetical protein
MIGGIALRRKTKLVKNLVERKMNMEPLNPNICFESNYYNTNISKTGFDVNIFEVPPGTECLCLKCFGVVNNPVSCPNKHNFCLRCIAQCEFCPSCTHSPTQKTSTPVKQSVEWIRNDPLDELVGSLYVNCKLVGCDWVGQFHDVHFHWNQCEFDLRCCSHYSCVWIGPKQDQVDHEDVCVNKNFQPVHV